MVLSRLPLLAVFAAAAAVLCLHVCEAAPAVNLPSLQAAAAADAHTNTLARRGYIDQTANGLADVATHAAPTLRKAATWTTEHLAKAATWSAEKLSKATGWVGEKLTEMSAKLSSKVAPEGVVVVSGTAKTGATVADDAATQVASEGAVVVSGTADTAVKVADEAATQVNPERAIVAFGGNARTTATVADEAAPQVIPDGAVVVSGAPQGASVISASEATENALEGHVRAMEAADDALFQAKFHPKVQELELNVFNADIKLGAARTAGVNVDEAIREKQLALDALQASTKEFPLARLQDAADQQKNILIDKLLEARQAAGQAA